MICPCVTTEISHWGKTRDFHMQGFNELILKLGSSLEPKSAEKRLGGTDSAGQLIFNEFPGEPKVELKLETFFKVL